MESIGGTYSVVPRSSPDGRLFNAVKRGREIVVSGRFLHVVHECRLIY
jgi:hypothetical protein